jgi:anthranilate 1,2-dioxygenase small subunit
MSTTLLEVAVTLADAQALNCAYADVLDDGELGDWPGFFADTCLYRIVTRENQRRGMPLAIMLCDSREGLFDRVEATEKANIFEPHWYRHILSDAMVLRRDGDALVVKTSFICVRTMQDGAMALFVSGAYVDEIVRVGERCLFRSKTVVVDQSRIDTLIAVPL